MQFSFSRFVTLAITVMSMTTFFGAAGNALGVDKPLVFISAFTAGEQGGVYAYHWDETAGKLIGAARTRGLENPFFLAVSPDNRFLYATHASSFGSSEPEHVVAFQVAGRSGELKELNRQSTGGSASCSLDVDATGRSLLVANFTTGNIVSLPIDSQGALGAVTSMFQNTGSSVRPGNQDGPHAHCVLISPDNRFAFVADLGLDKVFGYQLDAANAKLTPHRQAYVRTMPGAGPRHLTFHPNGKTIYAINELKNSVTSFDYDAELGLLFEKETLSTLPDDFGGDSYCADLKITPNGRFLYGTNRGHNSVAAYRISATGELELIGIEPSLGPGPQNLMITPSGRWLLCANMPGNNVAVFRIDAETGKLAPHGDPIEMPSPSCIMWLP